MNRGYITLIVIIIFLSACGSESEPKPEPPIDTDIAMKMGEIYSIHKGDVVIKKTEPAGVEFETNIDSGVTTSKLINGEVVIKVQ